MPFAWEWGFYITVDDKQCKMAAIDIHNLQSTILAYMVLLKDFHRCNGIRNPK